MSQDPPSTPESESTEAQALASLGPADPVLPPPSLIAPDLGGLYVEIEGVVALAAPEEIPSIFGDLKASLEGLKGTRAQQGKKVVQAIARAEELFLHLIQVREQMASEPPTKP